MPWTYEHFFTLPITVVIFIFFATWLGDKLLYKPEKYRLIPIHIISVLLVSLEIVKQIIGNKGGFDLYILPLHFCGLFVFLFPAFSLCHGKSKRTIRLITTISGLMMIGVMSIMPNVVYGNDDILYFFDDFLSFHTVFFHNLVLLGVILIFTLDLYEKPKLGDYKLLISVFAMYCILIAPLSLIFETNWNNFHHCNVSFVDNWRIAWINMFGYFGQILYTICASALTTGFSMVIYFVYTKILAWYERYKEKRYIYDYIG